MPLLEIPSPFVILSAQTIKLFSSKRFLYYSLNIEAENGIEYLYAWLDKHPNVRVVVINLNSDNLLGQSVKLIDLVSYHEGSIVSRTIIDKTTGTLTLFAFAEGQGLSEHTAPFDALVYLLDGEAEVTISSKALHLKEGDMVVMPANEPHALRAIKKFKMMLVMIKS